MGYYSAPMHALRAYEQQRRFIARVHAPDQDVQAGVRFPHQSGRAVVHQRRHASLRTTRSAADSTADGYTHQEATAADVAAAAFAEAYALLEAQTSQATSSAPSNASESAVYTLNGTVATGPSTYEASQPVADAALAERLASGGAASASGAGSDNDTHSMLREVAAIGVPCLFSVLAEPLMSLIDTACVGQVSSLELASLGPNTALFNLVFQVLSFFGVATTNIVASNSLRIKGLSAEGRDRRLAKCTRVLCIFLTLAGAMGLISMTLLLSHGAWMLQMLGATEEMLVPGLQYLRIRALASPAVLLLAVLNGLFVGQQDAGTPLRVCALAGVLNLAGDMWLTLGLRWGVMGAALATTVAQYMALAYALREAVRSSRREGGIPFTWVGLPRLPDLRPLFGVAAPLLSRTTFTMVAFTLITATATAFGTLPAAAHQVALQVFWFLSYAPEPLSTVAQTLMARDLEQPERVRVLARLLMRVSLWMGLILAALCAGAFLGVPRLFTNDAAVIGVLQPLALQAAMSEPLVAVVMCLDGIAIGTGALSRLPITNGLGLATTVAGCAWAARRAVDTASGLAMVWWSLVAFMAVRLAAHLAFAASDPSHALRSGVQFSVIDGADAGLVMAPAK